MKIKHLATVLFLSCAPILVSCQDDLSSQGSSLVSGEVTITVDSIPTFVEARSVVYDGYDARSTSRLLGRINVPEYGTLSCSFLSQLYPSPVLGINDTIPEADIDSMRLIISVPRGSLTGDSLAPQQLKVWRLNRQLYSSITNDINPADYYDASDPSAFVGATTYTLSALCKNDSAFFKDKNIGIRLNLPREAALETVRSYRANPELFQWPQTFAQSFPGLYIEQSFGNGCIGSVSNFGFYVYYHTYKTESSKDSQGTVTTTTTAIRDSVCLFSSAPEVLSSNVIDLRLSDNIRNLAESGKSVITTPGGYFTDIVFPAKEIIEKYKQNASMITVVSALSMHIPASEIANDFGISVAPYLLMVKKSEREEFFAKNKLPDQLTSFYAKYDEERKGYSFDSLRQYIVNLITSGKEITDEDVEFSIVPVEITTESVENTYTGTVTTYTVGCSTYLVKPTMTLLDTDNAIINFTYSKQEIE